MAHLESGVAASASSTSRDQSNVQSSDDSRPVFDLDSPSDDVAPHGDDYQAIVNAGLQRMRFSHSATDSTSSVDLPRAHARSDADRESLEHASEVKEGVHNTMIGQIHASPRFRSAIDAAQRTIQRNLSQREMGRFLRIAGDEFADSQLRRNSILVEQMVQDKLRDDRRNRAVSDVSVFSEPAQLSSSLPANLTSKAEFKGPKMSVAVRGEQPQSQTQTQSHNVRQRTESSKPEPPTPPPSAAIRFSPFAFDTTATAFINLSSAASRLDTWQRSKFDD